MLNKEKALFLKNLKNLNRKQLEHFLTHFNNDAIDSLCECVSNTIYTDLPINNKHKQAIKNSLQSNKSKSNIKVITKRKNSISKKRAALLQEGRGLGLIISALAPLLVSKFLNRNNSQ
jgi:hypothetical protein